MKIGPVRIAHPLTLAALEEHSNYPFRLLMKEFGASLVVSERVDAARVARRDRRGAATALHHAGRVAPRRTAQRRATPARWRRLPPWWKNWDSTWSI